MIDLRINSKLGIGENNGEQLLDLIKAKDLQVFSIADREHCLVYNTIDIKKHPQLITGVSFITSIDGLLIQIIGYEVNPSIINQYYYKKNSTVNLEKNELMLLDELKMIAKNNNLKLSEDLQLSLVEKGICKKLVYYDIIKHNPEFTYKSYKDFYDNGLSNPYSPFYLNESSLYPPLEEVIDIIHQANGIAFLANPYAYNIKVEDLIDKLIPYGIDGLEVFHPSSAIRQSMKLLDICKKHDLLASGGSDYRKDKYLIPIGINVSNKVLNSESFSWLNKYKNTVK